MTRVLHSTEIELSNDLDECKDLDELLEAHFNYIQRIHDRCFFHSSAKVLKEAVLKIMRLTNELHNLCEKDFCDGDLEKLVQMEEYDDDDISLIDAKNCVTISCLEMPFFLRSLYVSNV